MKITFSNLGAIKKTTLDLRPLTVIIGPNNSNKTYIAYSIYGLLKELNRASSGALLKALGFSINSSDSSQDNNLEELYEIDANGNFSYKLDNSFFSAYLKDCEQLTQTFEHKLNIFFQDTSRKLFNNTKYEVKFTKDELIQALKKVVNSNINPLIKAYQYSLEENIFYARFVNNAVIKKGEPNNYVADDLSFQLKSWLYPNPFLLPVERNALILTYKILENRRYNLLKDANRLFNNQQISIFEELNPSREENPRYPEPIEDFLKFLTNLELDVSLQKGKYSKLADIIEKDLQQNNKTNYISNEFGRKEIKINVNEKLDIDLYNASSSIKQLAPLLLYLRYRAEENDLLIIDEPEMNLHPESQAKLLEVLGILVNSGINVLLTTHSPYFMSHLNNLISGDMKNEETLEKQAESLYLKDSRAFLSPEDVSAYEMQQNKSGNQTLHDLHDKDYGIRWDTLSDVSANIQQKFFEIYEKGEELTNGKEE